MKKGAFTFVLHSHLPYCRRAGRWPHGEEWIHEAASGSYVPLLNRLYDLREAGCKTKLTIGLTPILVEQLADPQILEHFEMFLEKKLDVASADMRRFEADDETDRGHRHYLAQFYYDWYGYILRSFRERFSRSIIGAFKNLQDAGYIEVITSAATHGYLPLLDRDSSIYAQIKVGVDVYRKHFDRSPTAIWLPECAYRPAFYVGVDGTRYIKPGLEEFLVSLGLRCFFTETHTIEGGFPVGKAAGDAIGPYGSVPKRQVVPLSGYSEPTEKTTYAPYYVQSAAVAVLGRNNRTGLQVWSGEHGYPGDFRYREFHKKDHLSGLHYWKVTGAKTDLGSKEYYDPAPAKEAMYEHSRHFAALVEDLLNDYHAGTGKYGIISAAYDTELFGHWWFEGVDWLTEVLRILSQSESVDLTTASEYVAEHPPEDVLALPESSWGQAGNHFTWLNPDTEWMWPIIHEAEVRMEQLVARYPHAEGDMKAILNQAAREVLLLESSDWPFLVTTGQARNYAEGRFREHLARFEEMAGIAESGFVDQQALRRLQTVEELDNPFADIDYRVFAQREGVTA
ncbi:MAG: DUF1957 domain-containing protein [Chloroflexi bacterium]|nr:DUF1957 domain-containing protein [Chloroflexota bacterium]